MHALFLNVCDRACFQCMRNVSQVRVVLHHSFFMLKTAPESLAVPVMANLRFAPNLCKLASEAVAQAKVKSASDTFNGLHLRVEGDVTKFIAKVRALSNALPCVSPLMCKAECCVYHLIFATPWTPHGHSGARPNMTLIYCTISYNIVCNFSSHRLWPEPRSQSLSFLRCLAGGPCSLPVPPYQPQFTSIRLLTGQPA
jgi:hypothetical protein